MLHRKATAKQTLYRSFTLSREHVNEDDRTIELSFSSETRDVERWFSTGPGIEILDHSPKSVRLGRLKNKGPLLFLHEMNKHLGVIEDVSIEKRKGRALVRFGNSALAQEKYQDVLDRVLVHVSVGYQVFKAVLEEQGGDNSLDVYRITDWEPYEISLLPVPADIDVGVGRTAGESFEIEITEETIMPKENTNGEPVNQNRSAPPVVTPPPVAPVAPVTQSSGADTSEIENAAVGKERKRIADITSIGERFSKYGARELVNEHINKDTTVESFRALVMERLPTEDNTGSGESLPDTRLDLTSGELRKYNFMRAIRAVMAAKNGDTKPMKEAGFEMECSRELSERVDREARGFFVPSDVMASRSLENRAMNATSDAALIGTDHMGDMFIDTLRPRSIAMGLGATVMDGLVGNVDIPKALTNPTFGWIADDTDAGLTDPTTGSVLLNIKTLAGGVPMTRRLLKQSSPSVERMVFNALLKGSALGVDLGIFAGSGAVDNPLGVINQAGINTQLVFAPGVPTWNEVVGFETLIANDNAMEGKLAYVTTTGVRGTLKTTKKDAGSGIFLLENGELNGYPVGISNQLPANTILFGNWEDVYVGFWGVIDVNPDMATKAGSGGMILRVFLDADVAIGHAESFCKNV